MEWSQSLHWGWRRPLPLIRQTEAAECGVACLAMIAGWHGYRIDLPTLRGRWRISVKGMSFPRLVGCAADLGLIGRPVRLEIEELANLSLPCILHWDMRHFVVLKRVGKRSVEIHDPARGALHLSMSEVDRHFTGIALELTPGHAFIARDDRKRIRLSELTGKTRGLRGALTRLFIFALTLEILALLGPLINQLVIDDVLVAQDDNLLVLIIVALLLIGGLEVLLKLARQWATITLAVNFNMQWSANVFHHLLRLPVDWFEKRDIGAINARFEAVDDIQRTLTTQVLEALLDIVLVAGTLSMMMFYSVPLSALAMGTALLYGVLRALWFAPLRRAAEESWTAGTRESSHFLETVHGMLSLRVNGILARRESAWRNLNVDRRNAQLREEKLAMVYGILQAVITTLTGAAVLWLGAGNVLKGQFSVGMLIAYLSFQGRFSASITALIDKVFAYRMLDVYNRRLADIVLTPTVAGNAAFYDELEIGSQPPGEPVIEVQGLGFSYGVGEREILQDVSMRLMPGEVVALVGGSGGGKTTLAKLILGVYSPGKGSLKTFGISHTHPAYNGIGRGIGSVLQDDQLFCGSILDNLTLFASQPDEALAYRCAQLARLHEEIDAMPMGYQSAVGEMGSALSGGQKQRLLLARALYKRPQLLLLDEATSHLDIDNERAISRMLRQQGITVLLIAHRPETIASADRVLELMDGRIVPRG